MKKIIGLMLTLTMLVSMLMVTGAEETTLLTGSGGLNISDIEDYDVIKVCVTADDPAELKQGWGIGGVCFGGWTVETGFEMTSDGAHAEQSFEFSVASIVSKAAEKEADKININAYNGFTVTEVIGVTAGDEPIGVQLKGAGQGTISLATLEGYEKIVITIAADDPEVLKQGWGLGGICDSSWSALSGIDGITSTGVATQKHTFMVADILAAVDANETAIAINIYNGYSCVEVRGFVAEQQELEPDTTYKQVADNNVRFVQMISEEDAATYSEVNFEVKYNGTVKATKSINECYSSISVAGDTLTAPDGYVFVACVITNVPDTSLVTCNITFTSVAE